MTELYDELKKLDPHQINEWWWWYEEKGGICILHDTRGADRDSEPVKSINISWRSIRAALARKDRLEAK